MANRRELVVAIVSDARQYSKGFDKATRDTQKFGKSVDNASKGGVKNLDTRVKAVNASLRGIGGFFAAGVVAKGVGDLIQQAEALDSAYAITEQVISQTGGAANVTADEMKELAKQQALLTGISKQTILEGNNVLLTFKGIRNELGEGNDIFDRTSGLMLDIAATMGTDAKSAALQLGKALNDPVGQLGALSRSGLILSDSQKELVKDFANSGDLISAQKIILEELESQLGGTAAASADSSAKIARAFDEIKESLGVALLPGLDDLAAGLAIATGSTPAVQDLADVIKEIGGVNLSDTFQVGEFFGITDFEETLRGIIDAADLTDTELLELASGGMQELADKFDLSGSRAQVLADIIREDLIEKAFGSSRTPLQNMATGLDTAAGAAKNFERGARGVARADLGDIDKQFADTAISAEDAARAVGLFEDALRRQVDPVFKAISDQERLRSAQTDYTEAVEEFGAESQEAIDAGFDLASAQAAADDSARDLPANIDQATGAVTTLGEEAGIASATLSGMKAQIDGIDGTQANIKVFLDVTSNFNDTTRALIEGRNPSGGSSGSVSVSQFHDGGVVGGPRGSDQLILAAGGETVLPTHRAGGSSYGDTNFTVYAAPDRIVPEIQKEALLQSVTRFAESNFR